MILFSGSSNLIDRYWLVKLLDASKRLYQGFKEVIFSMHETLMICLALFMSDLLDSYKAISGTLVYLGFVYHKDIR